MKTIIKDVQGLVASLFPSIHRVAAPSHRRLRLSLLTLLLTLSITQAWGAVSIKNNTHIYYDPTNSNWDYTYIYLTINDAWGWKMSSVTGTKLRYVKADEYNNSGIRLFAPKSDWGNKNTNMGGWDNMSTDGNCNNISNWYGNDWTFDSNNTYVLTLNKKGSKSDLATITPTYLSDGYSALNSTQTIKCYVKWAGQTSYTLTNAPGTISITSYEMTGNGTTTKRQPTISTSENTETVSAARTATTTLVAPEVAGYTFDGWYESNNSTRLTTNKTYTYYPTSAKEVHACYTRNITVSATTSTSLISPSIATDITFTVTTNAPTSATIPYYYLVYGFGSSDANTGSNLNGDHLVSSGLTTTPNVTLAAGTWYTRVAIICNSVVVATSDKITITSATQYTLTYDGNDKTSGSVPATPTTYSSGSTPTVLDNTNSLTKTGFTFAGWNTAADGSGTDYTAGNSITMNANKTLYAKWTAIVTLDKNGGSANGSATATYKSGSMNITTAPIYTGKVITGYYEETGGDNLIMTAAGVLQANKSGYTNASGKWTRTTTPTTLYAHWGDHTWQLYSNNTKFGDFTSVSSTEYWLSLNITDANKGQWHYKLDGTTWYYTGADNPTTMDVTLVPGDGMMTWVGSNGSYSIKVFYTGGNWKIRAYPNPIITFGAGTGQQGTVAGVNASSVTITSGNAIDYNSSFTLTATPNTAYTFEGWYTDAACTSSRQSTSNPFTVSNVTSNKTYYAKFTPSTYTITLNNQSATNAGTESVNVTYNTTILSSIIKPTKTNYTFGGYFTATEGGGMQIIDANGNWLASKTGFTDSSKKSLVTENKTLYAYWTETTYTVNVAVGTAGAVDGTTDPNGNAQVGAVTPVTITAPTPRTGYVWSHWEATTGITIANQNDISTTITATQAGNVRAIYDEDLTTGWYLRGGSAFGGSAWAQDYQFMKKTGESTTSIAYYVVSISSTNNVENTGNENFQFKIRKGNTGDTYYGLTADGSSWWYYRSSGERTMNTSGKNIELRADVAGDYEFKIDYSNPALPKITVTYPPSLTWSAASVYSGNDATINVSVGNIVSGKSLKYELFAGATTTGSPLQTQNTMTTGTTATTTFTVNPAFAANEISKQYTVKITYNGTQTATYTSVVGRKWDIKVHDVCSWGSMKIYMWDAAGAYPTAFPGTNVPNLYGTWYTVTLDGRYPNFNLVKGSDSNIKSNDHTASLSSPGGYPADTYYYLRDCNTLSPVTPVIPTVELIIVDDQISTTQISLTGHITNCGNDGTTAAEMKEVGFYFGSTKYVATCTNDTYFYATITGLTAGTNYDIKAYAENIKGKGWTAVQTKSTRNDSPQSIKVRQSSGSTQLKIYAWTDIANDCAGGKLENATFPGVNMTRYGETQWWTYNLDNRYTHFIISQGTEASKTANISTPDGNACYDYNTSTHALTTRECWEITGIDDSYDLYTSKTLSITPTVIDPAGGTWNYRWMRKTGSNTTVNGLTTTGEVNTVNAVIASTSAEDATFEFKVFTSTPSKTLATKTTAIHSHEPITITTKVPNNNGWSMLKYHYWGSMNGDTESGDNKPGEFLMEADGHKYYSATFDEVYPLNFLAYDGTDDLLNYDTDQKYRMTLNVEDVTTTGCYLMGTTDAGTGSNAKKKSMTRGDYCPPTLYRVKVELPEGQDYGPAGWRTLYSNAASVGDKISYFAAYDATLTLQKLESGNWTNLAVVLSKPANRAENGIYQATVATDNLSSITAYRGDLYVRSFLATGGWEDYLDPEKDNVMTKFTPESDYNYYWVKYTGEDENKVKTVKNVYVTVGNAINPQLTRIINDGDGKVDNTGNVKDMNIRYSYNSHNNILNIAAIGGAVTASPIFLTVYGKNGRIYKTSTINEENKTLPGSETNHGEKQKKFNDVSNWVYQADVYANVTNGTNVTAAIEARLPSGPNGGTGTVQTLTPEDGLEVLGDNTTTGVYKLRLLYDYKTNTITTGWLPTDGQNITDNTVIEGNMIINRKENNSVEQINITGDKTVSGLHKLYMALEVTKKSCFTDNIGEDYAGGKLVYYWFSLPYECRVKDIMGAPGKYPDNWEIWEYDGAKRAREGLLDDATFFETVPFETGVLQANKGYCLGLYVLPGHFQNVTIDGETISSIYIYFPSRVEGYTLKKSATKQLVVPAQYDEAFFTRRPDRKKYDRDWNLMGVPSYNDISSITAPDAGVEHTYEAASAPGFIYDYLYTGGTAGSSENNKYKYIAVNSNAAGFKYKAFFSYMMQYAGTITWTSNSIENIKAAPAPRKPVRTGEHQLTQATLNLQLLANDEWLDNTFVSLLPQATDKVDHNIDLVKIWNSGSSQLCSLSEDVELAANCLSVDSQTVDLRVYIDNTRTYTFRLEEKVPDGLIALLEDTEAHTLTDLGSDAYTVDLMQGTYDGRFRLHLIVGRSDIGTDIDQLTNSVSYTLYGNEFLLNALTEPVSAALYDPAGRLLYQGIVNPGNTINLPDQAGVYLLRLPTQTLRIVK